MNVPNILVPLDGSEQALAAVPVAKVLSEIERVATCLLYVGEHEPPDADLHERLARGTPILYGLAMEARSGSPATEIVQAAREMQSRMIVMCKHSRPERTEMLGGTAMQVLREASCPVVLVPPERGVAPWHLQHMLVPHDGTPTTSAALKPAMQIADLADAELLVAHVTEAKAPPQEPGTFTTPRYVDQPQYDWPSWGEEFAKRLAGMCPLGHVNVRVSLARGDPAQEILRLSEKQSTDLIVLAWRGKWEAPRAQILKGILRRASFPVMVVRVAAKGRETVTEPAHSARGGAG